MPQESDTGSYEKADKKGHVPIIENKTIASTIKQLRPADTPPVEERVETDSREVKIRSLKNHTVMGIDGSRAEVPLDEEGDVMLGFIQVAVVTIHSELVDIEPQLVETDLTEYIDVEKLHLVVPSQGLRTREDDSLVETWRRLLKQQFKNRTLFGMSLEEAIIQLAERDEIRIRSCPNPECHNTDILIRFDRQTNHCSVCNTQVYISDIADAYNELSTRAPNLGPLESLMGFIENIAVYLTIKHASEAVEDPIIVKDGPLAEYKCHEEWTASALERGIQSLRTEDEYPILFGINKSGDFYQHAAAIDEYVNEKELVELPQDHIRGYVKKSSVANQFGRDTYYGKQFIYYDTDKRPRVFSVPRQYHGNEVLSSADDYPWAAYIPSIIETLRTPHFDGLLPLTIAHNEASIPDNKIAREALAEFSKSVIDGDAEKSKHNSSEHKSNDEQSK